MEVMLSSTPVSHQKLMESVRVCLLISTSFSLHLWLPLLLPLFFANSLPFNFRIFHKVLLLTRSNMRGWWIVVSYLVCQDLLVKVPSFWFVIFLSHSLAEPYNYFGRRGRKEPEALAAASLKRLFVQNQPYLVSGYSQHTFSGNLMPSYGVIGSKFSSTLQRLKSFQLDAPNNILSMAEKYRYMRETFRKRLAFGKNWFCF